MWSCGRGSSPRACPVQPGRRRSAPRCRRSAWCSRSLRSPPGSPCRFPVPFSSWAGLRPSAGFTTWEVRSEPSIGSAPEGMGARSARYVRSRLTSRRPASSCRPCPAQGRCRSTVAPFSSRISVRDPDALVPRLHGRRVQRVAKLRRVVEGALAGEAEGERQERPRPRPRPAPVPAMPVRSFAVTCFWNGDAGEAPGTRSSRSPRRPASRSR